MRKGKLASGKPLVLMCGTMLAAVACGGSSTPAPSNGEALSSWPDQTVNVVIPYASGGQTDLVARTVTKCMGEDIGGDWVPKNKPGSSGSLGMSEIANASSDGYTLGVGTDSTLVNNPVLLEGDVGYEYTDFTYIGRMLEVPSGIMVPADSEYKDIKQLIQAAKSESNNVTVATAGPRVHYSLAMRQLSRREITFEQVPFEGSSKMTAAVLGGNVDAKWDVLTRKNVEYVKSGRMRVLAVDADERLSYLPKAPTLGEAGLTDLVDARSNWFLVGPDGLDKELVGALQKTLGQCMQKTKVQDAVGPRYVDFDATEKEVPQGLRKYQRTLTDLFS